VKQAITITVDADALSEIDKFLEETMTPRSKYFNKLMKNDLKNLSKKT
jgi:metal-responsive CopG/Arc/MetJ family transcriptional regulator